MIIQTLTADDWSTFADMACAEGWKVPLHEQRLFQNHWKPYFFVLKKQGRQLGYVSAVAYRNSGWIGNLIVHPSFRGQGYGSELLSYALAFLDQPQVERIWLTSTEQSVPFFRKAGFSALDRVERWSAPGLGLQAPEESGELDDLIYLDFRCWGEAREALLRTYSNDSTVLRHGTTMALLQNGLGFCQLGPWLTRDLNSRDLRALLQEARSFTPADKSILSDILLSDELNLVLRSCGFECVGSSLLMCLSHEPVSFRGVIALASLGSIG